MNYAIIGSVIGHEITHGFDDQGRQFDKNGKLADWWAPTTNEKFNKKAECIINQYGNYTIKELGLHVRISYDLINNCLYFFITFLSVNKFFFS